MSRVKANWRRIATWFDGFKKAGEGWTYLQTWENPAATIGTMAGLTSICFFPHMMVSLALTGLIIFMVRIPRLNSSHALHFKEQMADMCSVFVDFARPFMTIKSLTA